MRVCLPPSVFTERRCNQTGFTLLEVMLVLLLIGLAAGYVMFNAFGSNPAEQLEREVRRLQIVVDMASDFAVLNQQQLGLYFDVEARSYTFMQLDEEDNWLPVEDSSVFTPVTLTEPFFFTLELDDLPWQQDDSLFSRELFDSSLSVNDKQLNIGEEAPPPPPPQVLILSSGDVTPFSLTFAFEPDFGDTLPAYFVLNNPDTPPLELIGPLEQRP